MRLSLRMMTTVYRGISDRSSRRSGDNNRCPAKTFTGDCHGHNRRARRFDHGRHPRLPIAGRGAARTAPATSRASTRYWLMQAHPDWRVLNRGVNGERSDQIRARFARDVVAAAARTLVVIIAGVNDVYQGRSADVGRARARGDYDAARAAKIPVVAGSIIPYNTATPEQNARMHAGQRLDPRVRASAPRRHGVLRHAGGRGRAGRRRPPACPLRTTFIRRPKDTG